MELVYLWVEEYKNIKQQGFNFSPRFECEFKDEYEIDENEKEKLKDNCELIIRPKEHIKDFFGENINVTAIVGENGSGKSSIFELLSKILTLDSNFEKFNYFYVLNDDLKNICYSNNINILTKNINVEKHIPRQIVHGNLNRGTANHNVALNKYFDVSYLNISHLERDGIIKNDSPSRDDPIKYYGIYKKNDFNLHKENSLYPTFSGFKLSQFNFFQTYAIANLLVEDKYKKLFFEVFKIKQPYSLKIDYIKENLEKIKTSNTPNGDPSRAIDESLPDQIDKIFEFLITIDNDLIIESGEYKTFFTLVSSANLEEEFRLTFQTKENKTIKLSAGEKTILFYLERIDFMLSLFTSKSNILLFDEIELYLHPNWQKRILKIILGFIQENKLMENLHIIIASHSPFILSDLPKENVIFLEKDKDGNCTNSTKNININPFGANIHTLLSHGFFMKDGLMGEFAKEKINSIIKNLSDKNYQIGLEGKKQLLFTIKSIGEEFLKSKLLDMYYKKFDDELTKKQRKEELQREQEKIKKELEQYD